MAMNRKRQLAAILRAAAKQTIAESDFWTQFEALTDSHDPIEALAYEPVIHYWGNFHQINIFGFKAKPNKNQVQQGQEELNLLADALEGDWTAEETLQKLNDI